MIHSLFGPLVGAALVLPLVGAAAQAQLKAPAKPLAITHVTLIDGTGKAAQPDMSIIITGDRITAVGKAGSVAVPEGSQTLDGSGKFLIPGLWDMHVHVIGREAFPLFLANGVTGIREMANYPQLIFPARDRIAEGAILGPRIIAAGLIVDGPKPIWPFSIPVRTAAEGREAVHTLQKQGANFIKVYSLLPRDGYFAVAEEAKKMGLAFAGHVPITVTAAEASDAGQKSMEHLTGLLIACSSKHAELHHQATAALDQAGDLIDRMLGLRTQVKALESYDPKVASELFARFVKNGTWQCPTLTVWRGSTFLNDKQFTDDPRLKYISPTIKSLLYPDLKTLVGAESYFADRRRLYKKYLELVGELHRAKVPLLAGTDCPNAYCFPGFSLHDELELLVSAGLKPAEALHCATANPAKYLGKLADLGTIERGKLADIVMLEADPLADIRNTRKIAAVVANGRLLRKETLQKMLTDVEEQFKK